MLSREQGEWDPAFKAPHGFWPHARAHPPPPPLSCSLPQGIFLVYDISSERSYQHIMKWVSDVDEVGDATSPLGWGRAPQRGRRREGRMGKAEALEAGEQTLPGKLALHSPG